MRKRILSLFVMLAVACSMVFTFGAIVFADEELPVQEFDKLLENTIDAGGEKATYHSWRYHTDKDASLCVYVESRGSNDLYYTVQGIDDPSGSIANNQQERVKAGDGAYDAFYVETGDFYVSVINEAASETPYYVFVTEQPAKTKLSSVKAGKKSLTAKWKKVSGADKYAVSYKLGNGKWKVKVTKKTSLKISGLKKGKKYKVMVQAIRTVNNIPFASDASNTKTVKVK